MKLYGQKWIFQDGNHEIIVENAWSWTMYSQTRIKLNEETVFEHAAYFWVAIDWTTGHSEPWISQIGDETLSVAFISRPAHIDARVTIGDRELEPVDYFEGNWRAKGGHWPD